MDRENYEVINSVGGNVDFLKLVERGRQIHDEAIFDLFARLMSSGVRFVKAHLFPSFRKEDRQNHYQGASSIYTN